MLSSTNRFHGHGSLRYLYRNGSVVRSQFLTLKYTKNTKRKNSRFAIVVSKKTHKSAVGRNRIRRRLYEIIRNDLKKFKEPYDIVVLVFSSEFITMSSDKVRETLEGIFSQAGLYK